MRVVLTSLLLLLTAAHNDVEPLRKVAANATKTGFHSLARRCARDSALLDGTAKIAAKDEDDSPKLSARKRSRLLEEYRKARSRVAADLAEAAGKASGEEKTTLAKLALRFDRENADARRILGLERVKGLGWVPAADAKRYRDGLLPLEGKWQPRREVERARKDWKKAFTIESDFFRIRSNLPLDRILELRDLLDTFHEKWTDNWDGHLPLRDGEHRHEVLIFAKKAEYEGHLEATDPRRIVGVPGQYSPEKRRAVFFDVETMNTGKTKTSSIVELMLHECTHQLMYEDAVGKPTNLEGAAAPNFWLHEGIAELYGMHTMKGKDLVLDRSAVKKMLRTAYLKQYASQMLPVPELDRIGRQEFLGKDMNDRRIRYAQAGFLAMFLAEGKRAGAFRRMVRELYCGENGKGLIGAETGEDVKAIDREFRRFVRGL